MFNSESEIIKEYSSIRYLIFMNYTIDAIRNRRSIRKYASRSISSDIIRDLLDAAIYAPSAHNAQPWRFLVLSDMSHKRIFAQIMAKSWIRDLQKDGLTKDVCNDKMRVSIDRFANVPVLILACLTMEDMNQYPDSKRRQFEHDLAVQSLSAAIQNILLAAHEKGLGACWYCAPIFCKTSIKPLLKLPNNIEPQALITIGYPAETPNTPRRKLIENIAYFNEWGNNFS